MSKSAWTEKDQIDNFLKERRLMRSLEKVVGGRLYEGDLRSATKDHMISSYDGEAKTTSSTSQAQVTCVSESVSHSKSDAKTFKVNEELRKGRWWEIVRRRPTAATKDHMISSYDVLIIQQEPEGSTQGYPLVSVEVLRNILQICLKLLEQHFVDTLFEEDILAFMRELGYSGTIKLLSDVKVDLLPQPWRIFATIINKCLSGKVIGIDTLRLSRLRFFGVYIIKKMLTLSTFYGKT
ncbi:hypothetical protein Tco_0266862 [Tanacetum coccineum]